MGVKEGASKEGMEELPVASVIGNGEDLSTTIRAAFEIGKPDALLVQLRSFVKNKEMEIEDLCRLHYEEFIHAVDELRNVLVDAEDLKMKLSDDNNVMQQVGKGVLGKLDELIEYHGMKKNLMEAIQSLNTCMTVVHLCTKVNDFMDKDHYYPALKTLETMERDYLQHSHTQIPAQALCLVLERQIPLFRSYIEKKVNMEFNDWLVDIRIVAREIGQLSIGQASSARQREEELRSRQRLAEEQSRLGASATATVSSRRELYMLENEDMDEDDSLLKFELTPVYRAHYIHKCLGIEDEFRAYYLKNRHLQLMSDLQMPSSGAFLECHQTFFAQIAGFFIVEDRVLRTGGGVIESLQVDNLWESAVNKMKSVVEEQFSRMQTATHVLLVKDYVSLLAATLRRYGYHVAALLDVLDKMRDKYHDLLLSDCRKQVNDVVANDKYEQMLMRKEYEYNMNVLAFQLQSSESMPAFPYVAPFSSTIPEFCRIVRSFIEDSVSFLSYDGGHVECYQLVNNYVEKLLINVINEALMKLIRNPSIGMSQAMQIAANVTVFQRACDFFSVHVGRQCGIPVRMMLSQQMSHQLTKARQVLTKCEVAAQERMLELVKSKIDDFMLLTAHINWTPDDAPLNGNAYLNDVVIYLETLTPSAQAILPPHAFHTWMSSLLQHISQSIITTLATQHVSRFNINAIMGLDADLRVLESFASQHQLNTCLSQLRQLINLFLSNQPELFLNPVIRDKNYNTLDYKQLISIAEKFRDLPSLSSSSSRKLQQQHQHQHAKKKSLDTLIKRLKELAA